VEIEVDKMPLFLSTFTNKIDVKGRVSVPASFRASLASEVYQGIVVFRSHAHVALEGFAFSSMQDIAARLDHYDLFSGEQDDLATAIFGDSVQLPFDGDGRIILPEPLIAHADLDGQAAFVGLGQKFQIWNPEEFEGRRDSARDNVKSGGLTIPKNTGGAS